MRKISVLTALLLMGIFALLAQTVEVRANGNETLGNPTGITIKTGSGIVSAGTGLELQPGMININIPLGATVKQVLLYWQCKGTGDSNITLNGSPLTGASIGSSSRGQAFRADITSRGLVDEGSNELTIEDLACQTTSDGASVLVIFDQKVEAAEFSGEATVLDAFINLLGIGLIDVQQVHAGPLPPEGGNFSDTAASLDVPPGGPPGPIVSSKTASASTIGGGNESVSEAEVEDLGLNILNLIVLGAGVIRAEATAQCDSDGDASVSGDSEILDLGATVGVIPVDIPLDFPANTELLDPPLNVLGLGTVRIVANEQIVNDTGSFAEITVNALHITVTALGSTVVDIVISSAHADIDCEIATPVQIPLKIKDGFDWAWINRPEPLFKNTVIQSFTFSSASTVRTGNVTVFVGDCDASRPDSIVIKTFNAQNTQLSQVRLVDRCSSGEGFKWDNIVVPVPIPAGATKLTVHVRSAKDPKTKLTTSPDSLGWILAALSGPFAQGITFSGRATVARVAILEELVNVALGDTGNLPPSGGVLEEPGVNVNIPPVISSGTGTAKTVGAGNASNSEAKVEDLVGLNVLGVLTLSGEVLSAKATASCSVNGIASASGTSTLANLTLVVNGNPIVVAPNPPANTVLINNLNLLGVGVLRIVVNEQVKPQGNLGDITVNALHITIRTPGSDTNDIVDVVIAHAHADIACK